MEGDCEDDMIHLEITNIGIVPPPPTLEGIFTHVLMKAKNDAILSSESGLGHKLVMKGLLNGIVMEEDVAKYKNMPMDKLRTFWFFTCMNTFCRCSLLWFIIAVEHVV